MLKYLKILEKVQPELKEPLMELADAIEERIRSQLAVPREDFSSLRATVEETAQMQKEAEKRLSKSEGRLDRIEATVEEIVQIQKKSEGRLDRIEATFEKFERTFVSKMGALGARWGLESETAFREGMRGLLKDTELAVERYFGYDEDGKVFGEPNQIELDLVIKDSEVYLVEIKSSLGRADAALFERKVRFYEEKEGRTPSRKVVIAPFIEPGAMELAEKFSMEVYSDINKLYQ